MSGRGTIEERRAWYQENVASLNIGSMMRRANANDSPAVSAEKARRVEIYAAQVAEHLQIIAERYHECQTMRLRTPKSKRPDVEILQEILRADDLAIQYEKPPGGGEPAQLRCFELIQKGMDDD